MKANWEVGNVPQLGIVKHQIILVMHDASRQTLWWIVYIWSQMLPKLIIHHYPYGDRTAENERVI